MHIPRLLPLEMNRSDRAAIRFTRLLSAHALIRASCAYSEADRRDWLALARVRASSASQVILRARSARSSDGASAFRASS